MTGEDRDDRILAHVGLYRVTFRRILARIFFDGREKACQNVVDRLLQEGSLCDVQLGGSALKYYQLSPGEAAKRGIRHRARSLGGRALSEAIGVLWFCTILAQRYRLERKELCSVLGPAAPQGTHCAEPGNPARIYRIYLPGPWTKPAAIAASLDEIIASAKQTPVLSGWITNRLYGIAVLVPTEARANLIQQAIASKRIGEGTRIILEQTPDAKALPGALYALKRP